MKTELEVSDMVRKMTGTIDREDVRREVGNEIAKISLIADPSEFRELLSRFIRFSDAAEVLREKWRIVYNNSKQPLELIAILAQDDSIRLDMLSNIDFLIDYGENVYTSRLALAISKLEGGSEAITSNFEKLFEDSDEKLENIVIPMLQNEIGRGKVKNNFEAIKNKFLTGPRTNVNGFLETIKALKGIKCFEDIYEEFGFWAEIFDQIEVPKRKKVSAHTIFKLSKKEIEKLIELDSAELVKDETFTQILNSESREEKKLVLQKVANGNEYRYKACGSSSFIIQAGDQIVKLGAGKRKFEVPYHPRIMMPWFRKKYQDNTILEVFNYGNTESAKITDEELLDIYKEMESAGILWGDARKSNLLELTKDNDLPDFIASEDFNLFGFLEDARYPTNNHIALKAGDIVICDLDMLYVKGDPDYEVGILDDIIANYLLAQKMKPLKEDGLEY